MKFASTLCKGCATLNSTLEWRSGHTFVVFFTGEEGEAFVAAFVASTAFVASYLSNADVLSLGRNCGKQIPYVFVSSPRGDILPLPCSTCLLFLVVCYSLYLCGISGLTSRVSGLPFRCAFIWAHPCIKVSPFICVEP